MNTDFDQLSDDEQTTIGERISEALICHYQGGTVDGVTLNEVFMINAANHRVTGEIDDIPFCVEIGDIGGFCVITWGEWPEPEPVAAPDPIVLGPRYIPLGVNRKEFVQEFMWRHDVQEAAKARRYDLMFSPTRKTLAHYDALAKRLGGFWMHKSERAAMMKED